MVGGRDDNNQLSSLFLLLFFPLAEIHSLPKPGPVCTASQRRGVGGAGKSIASLAANSYHIFSSVALCRSLPGYFRVLVSDSPDSNGARWWCGVGDRKREENGGDSEKAEGRGQERTGRFSSSLSCRGSSHAESSQIFPSRLLVLFLPPGDWLGPMAEKKTNKQTNKKTKTISCL